MKKEKEKKKPANSQEYIEQMVKRKRKVVKISIIAVILIIILLIVSTAFAIATMASNKIIDGVTIGNIDVSGLNKDEAYALLESKLQERQSLRVKLKYQDYEKEISMEQLEVTADVEKAVDKALEIGRDGNIFANNFNIVRNKFSKKNIDIEIKYNKEELERILTDIGLELPGVVQEYTYSIEDDELIITSGTDGIVIDQEEMKNMLNEIITDLAKDISDAKDVTTEENVLDPETENIEETVEHTVVKKQKQIEREIKVKQEKARAIDIDQIYSEVYSEPEDAYIIEEPFQVVVDKSGVDFAITIDEAKAMIEEEKNEYVIPLKITPANTRVADLGSRAFPDLLATYTTRYDAGNVSRTTNLAIACNKINGYVIAPGEVFSYNQVLGKRTSENGYKEAAVYVAGGVENGLGGGICQISTTLYNSVVMANLGIEERHNHSYTTSYSDPGRDATVSYGVLDFKFKNTRQYPVKIEAYIKSGVATVSIYGIKENPDYTVKIVSTVTATIPCPEERIDDPTLPEGTETVVTKGTNGCRSVTYKYTYSESGELVSKVQLSADSYGTIKRVVKVGTKKVEETKETSAEPDTTTTTQTQPQVTPSTSPSTTPSGATTPTETTTPQSSTGPSTEENSETTE